MEEANPMSRTNEQATRHRVVSIRTRLVAFPAAALALSAFLMLYVHPRQQGRQVRASAEAQVHTLADMIGFAIATGLETENYSVVHRALETVRADSRIEFVRVRDASDKLLTSYEREASTASAPKARTDRLIVVEEPLLVHGERYGSLRLGFSMQSLESDMARSRHVLAWMSALVVGLGLALSWWQASRVAKAILACRDLVLDVSRGALASRVRIRSRDELGVLADHLNLMTDRLAAMVRGMADATCTLATSSSNILDMTAEQSACITEQAASMEEATATVDSIRATSRRIAEHAGSVGALTHRSMQAASAGTDAVRGTLEVMAAIEEGAEEVGSNIALLSEHTRQMGEIIASVDQLAEQSQLLAVNASIVAVQAGDKGKAFAVVALEMCNLAEQSKSATHQVRRLLGDIRSATDRAVLAVERSTAEVAKGVASTRRTGETIEELAERVQHSTQAAEKIQASLTEQVASMDAINVAMGHINQATRDSLRRERHAERATRDLHALGRQLQALIELYDSVAEDAAASPAAPAPDAGRDLEQDAA